jgi:hypothetical protein
VARAERRTYAHTCMHLQQRHTHAARGMASRVPPRAHSVRCTPGAHLEMPATRARMQHTGHTVTAAPTPCPCCHRPARPRTTCCPSSSRMSSLTLTGFSWSTGLFAASRLRNFFFAEQIENRDVSGMDGRTQLSRPTSLLLLLLLLLLLFLSLFLSAGASLRADGCAFVGSCSACLN